jgi:hypothetical protein
MFLAFRMTEKSGLLTARQSSRGFRGAAITARKMKSKSASVNLKLRLAKHGDGLSRYS